MYAEHLIGPSVKSGTTTCMSLAVSVSCGAKQQCTSDATSAPYLINALSTALVLSGLC